MIKVSTYRLQSSHITPVGMDNLELFRNQQKLLVLKDCLTIVLYMFGG